MKKSSRWLASAVNLEIPLQTRRTQSHKTLEGNIDRNLQLETLKGSKLMFLKRWFNIDRVSPFTDLQQRENL